jgi:hypothetical protein
MSLALARRTGHSALVRTDIETVLAVGNFRSCVVASVEGVEREGGANLSESVRLIRPTVTAFNDWADWPTGGGRYLNIWVSTDRGAIKGRWKRLPGERLAEIEAGVLDRRIEMLFISATATNKSCRGAWDQIDLSFVLGVTNEYHRPKPRRAIVRPRVTVTVARLDDADRRAHALDDLDLVQRVFEAAGSITRPATGWATVGSQHARPPLWLHVTPETKARTGSCLPDRAFGYDWVQLLTPTMIDELRRHGRDLTSAPAELVRPFEVDGELRFVLISPRVSPWETTEHDMRRLRKFLEPILIATGPPVVGSYGHSDGWKSHAKPDRLVAEDWFGGSAQHAT